MDDARKVARARSTRESAGPEWPKADDVDTDAALAELCIAILSYGLKVAAGNLNNSPDIWVRLTMPDDAVDDRAGRVAFTVSDTLDKALRKAVQLLESDSEKVWKPNQWKPPTDK